MKIQSVGHVVLNVRNRQRSEEFYNGLLGIPVCAKDDMMAFFTLGGHHDFGVIEVGEEAQNPSDQSVGLAHVAFKIGDCLDALLEAKERLEAAGITTRGIDHVVTKSLYFEDPDGNNVELYVDTSDIWKEDGFSLFQVRHRPLEI
ncbi:MAG TPA: VOC family protein [Anaerolineae bacterium]|nr:VOC family protein [Anaerolineae bacterium]